MNRDGFRAIMDSICPEDMAVEWDNSGFQIAMPGDSIGDRVLVALDITDAIIDQAEMIGADTIVTHHPLFFDPLKSLSYDDSAGRYAMRLAAKGISVYSCHTNFDRMQGGINDEIGRLLGMRNIEIAEEEGFARCGNLPRRMSFDEFCDHVAESLSIDRHTFRLAGAAPETVERVSWCGGSGSEFASCMLDSGSDIFLTGDLKYHVAKDAAETGLSILDIGHFGSEKCFTPRMLALLRRDLPKDSEVFAALGEKDGWTQL